MGERLDTDCLSVCVPKNDGSWEETAIAQPAPGPPAESIRKGTSMQKKDMIEIDRGPCMHKSIREFFRQAAEEAGNSFWPWGFARSWAVLHSIIHHAIIRRAVLAAWRLRCLVGSTPGGQTPRKEELLLLLEILPPATLGVNNDPLAVCLSTLILTISSTE